MRTGSQDSATTSILSVSPLHTRTLQAMTFLPWQRQSRLLQLATCLMTALWIPITVDCYSSVSPFSRIQPSLVTSRRRPVCSRLQATTRPDSQRRHDEEDDSSSRKHNVFVESSSPENDEEERISDNSRRRALQSLLVVATTTIIPAGPALAGKPEYDTTGVLYTPKAQMLSGGSAAARGIAIDTKTTRLQPGQALQTVYETRFIAYLSRFLLNFDPAALAWWAKNNPGDDTFDFTDADTRIQVDAKFAEFAESVEIGLADYFVGPYGSYSSLQAAKAGIEASNQAKSSRPPNDPSLSQGWPFGWRLEDFFMERNKKELMAKDISSMSKQGILNLYTLLKARYTSLEAKRQLAILFSFFSDNQPIAEIKSLLGEADNATVTKINLVKPFSSLEATSRTSSRRGGGYTVSRPPTVLVEPPPALGSSYRATKVKPIMKPTFRILRIRVTDGGEGYTTPPEVFVRQGVQRRCAACAILDREGHVDSVLVLDPGYGYGKRKLEPPLVIIARPGNDQKSGTSKKEELRGATAVAELEYEIAGLEIVEGGNGYVSTEPPKVTISPPEEGYPDWYVDIPELAVQQADFGSIRAEVAQMRCPNGNLAFSIGSVRPRINVSIDRIKNDPLGLLPSSVRPERNSLGCYIIPPIAAIPTYSTSPNPRYRAVDPIFGAIGTVPVTKSAMELKAGEYARLALSGAVCTVLVRTALNPLELIKTKQQLQNDQDLLEFARETKKQSKPKRKDHHHAEKSTLTLGATETSEKVEVKEKLGSLDLIFSLVKLRGPLALFQSADITFLASLMFGSFGFAGTELFRRSFTMAFSSEGSEQLSAGLVLLLAATVATIITSAFAAPFELLRVRSMGLVESKEWTDVLGDFIKEKEANGDTENASANEEEEGENGSGFSLSDVKPKDLLPLWAGFPPTATRELAFAIPKFLAFDALAKTITGFINAQAGPGSLPIQVGVGTTGLLISAISGAVAGIAGALVSHPADLILTYTSASKKKGDAGADWKEVVKEMLSREGGIANLFVGLSPRLVFFFLVIGLQFFLYDYVKGLLEVGSDDLSLVLDVFYAVRQGLVGVTE